MSQPRVGATLQPCQTVASRSHHGGILSGNAHTLCRSVPRWGVADSDAMEELLTATWQWESQSRSYANYGNANQWTVNAGLSSLARESAQNSNDARLPGPRADLVYSFIVLTGQERKRFEESLGWRDHLEPHLASMADAATGAVTAGQLQSGLAALQSSEALTLLRIADYGARGLTGPEFAEGDPRSVRELCEAMCRLDLYSGKDKTSGGSFGLGKAVYWRFSRLQTVLFNSMLRPEDAVDGLWRNRIIGVNQGVVHQLGGNNFQGRGFFGNRETSGEISSVWDSNELAENLYLAREDNRPGTSACWSASTTPTNPRRGLATLARFGSSLRASKPRSKKSSGHCSLETASACGSKSSTVTASSTNTRLTPRSNTASWCAHCASSMRGKSMKTLNKSATLWSEMSPSRSPHGPMPTNATSLFGTPPSSS